MALKNRRFLALSDEILMSVDNSVAAFDKVRIVVVYAREFD